MSKSAPSDISLTARYTAAVWDQLGLPYASLFADWRGKTLVYASLWGGRLLPRNIGRALIDAMLTPRHLFMDDWIRENGIEQVVEIAAGFSPRGLMFAAEGLNYVEVDRPAVMAEKEERAHMTDLESMPVFLGIDATASGLAESVLAACKPGLKTVVITEGFSMYFSREAYAGILSTIQPLCKALNAVYLTDFMRNPRGRSAFRAWFEIGRRAVWFVADHVYLYCKDEAETKAFFAEAGFDTKVHLPAKERRYTNGVKPVREDLVYIVEAAPR